MSKIHIQTDSQTGQNGRKLGFAAGVELTLVPAVELNTDAAEQRYEKLASITADYAVPRLLALHAQIAADKNSPPVISETEIHELARLVLGPEAETAAGSVMSLKDSGVSLDALHSELLGPTASYLGELWNNDKIDFVDVTLGVARLQRLVVAFEGLDKVFETEERRKILIVGAPGEQHNLGHTIVQRFFRASGWQAWSCITSQMEDAARVTAEDWFGIVGFSLSHDLHFQGLRSAISRIRTDSVNRNIGVIVGGSAIARNPGWVHELGADGTAANGPAAVILAKTLLAAAPSRQS